jgi:hypothetical protein
MSIFCCDDTRREQLRHQPGPVKLNGIDWLEVVDQDAPSQDLRQRILRVNFVLAPPPAVSEANVLILGGLRVQGIRVEPGGVSWDGDVLVVRLDRRGDFSPYTLCLVDAADTGKPMSGLDPVLWQVGFRFKVECPSDFDCRRNPSRARPPPPGPYIDYLAKDYAGFRRLMLDRISALAPAWQERNPADVGIVLVELLAYAADYFSYQQDGAATEAYLGTARRRVSVRRHARLVDYAMHDGCNARAWVQIKVRSAQQSDDDDGIAVPAGTVLLTGVADSPGRLDPFPEVIDRAVAAGSEVFQTMHDARLYPAHNRMLLHTWGGRRCCLPKGATQADLAGRFEHLHKGDVLVFQEALGPRTGDEADADPDHRHAVRLSAEPAPGEDAPFHQPVTHIEWAPEDALPFALCISTTTRTDPVKYIENLTVVLGNIVLADHGRTVTEDLEVPADANGDLAPVDASACDPCGAPSPQPRAPRIRLSLKQGPVTQIATVLPAGACPAGRAPFDAAAPASAAFPHAAEHAVPAVALLDHSGTTWVPRRDLLASDAFAPDFVAEIEEDGRAVIRFGDDEYGRCPAAGAAFTATYRIGNGAAGNAGADSITHVAIADSRVVEATNPLPARGGTEPETVAHVRQTAPAAFRVQQRAVTAEDYAEMTQRHPQVQRAVATIRWTGSWHTVFLTVDRIGGRAVDGPFRQAIRDHLEAYRLAGHDVEIDGPRFVPLEIEMEVCVRPDYFRSDVAQALLDVFSNRILPDGRMGLFHPDRLTFGQPVYLSALVEAAQAVEGVRWVGFTTFRRLGGRGPGEIASGVLSMDRLEIARLDNDPNFPDRGALRLAMEGGR